MFIPTFISVDSRASVQRSHSNHLDVTTTYVPRNELRVTRYNSTLRAAYTTYGVVEMRCSLGGARDAWRGGTTQKRVRS